MWWLHAQTSGFDIMAEGVFCRPHAKLPSTLAFRRLSILAFPSLNPTGRFLFPRVCFFRPLPIIEIYANTNPYDKLSSSRIAWDHTRLDTPAPLPHNHHGSYNAPHVLTLNADLNWEESQWKQTEIFNLKNVRINLVVHIVK